jgi:hypothetical protein
MFHPDLTGSSPYRVTNVNEFLASCQRSDAYPTYKQAVPAATRSRPNGNPS